MRGFDSDNAWQDFGRVVGRPEAIESHRAPTGQRINLKVQKRAFGKSVGEASNPPPRSLVKNARPTSPRMNCTVQK